MDFYADRTASADRIKWQRETLSQSRRVSEAAGIHHEQATVRAAQALAHARALDRRLARLTSTSGEAAADSSPKRSALRVMSRLDQAEAAANEILMADAGPRLDALAELIAKVVDEAYQELADVPSRSPNQ